MASVGSLALRTGGRMPAIGFGTFQAKGMELQDALYCALDVGYRHIDTAISYQNDLDIGESLAAPMRAGKIERRDIFLTTKVPPVYMAAKDVRPCVLESMDKLQVKYLDMLLIHAPFGCKNQGDGNLAPVDSNGKRILADHDYVQTWRAMERLVKDGKVRSLGLSNFSSSQIHEIIQSAVIPPVNLQMECHAYLQQKYLRQLCNKLHIIPTAYSPLGAPTRPPKYTKDSDPCLLADPVVGSIAKELNTSAAQVLIRYFSYLDVIPLPKSVTPERIQQNFEALKLNLTAEHVAKLQHLDNNIKYFVFQWAKEHPRYPPEEF